MREKRKIQRKWTCEYPFYLINVYKLKNMNKYAKYALILTRTHPVKREVMYE